MWKEIIVPEGKVGEQKSVLKFISMTEFVEVENSFGDFGRGNRRKFHKIKRIEPLGLEKFPELVSP